MPSYKRRGEIEKNSPHSYSGKTHNKSDGQVMTPGDSRLPNTIFWLWQNFKFKCLLKTIFKSSQFQSLILPFINIARCNFRFVDKPFKQSQG